MCLTHPGGAELSLGTTKPLCLEPIKTVGEEGLRSSGAGGAAGGAGPAESMAGSGLFSLLPREAESLVPPHSDGRVRLPECGSGARAPSQGPAGRGAVLTAAAGPSPAPQGPGRYLGARSVELGCGALRLQSQQLPGQRSVLVCLARDFPTAGEQTRPPGLWAAR